MSDTRIENAICEAIDIIADKKVADAGFDHTISATVIECIDGTTGKYKLRYQDKVFEAYAMSSSIHLDEDQTVFVLLPGNNWNRTKTILTGADGASATNYAEVELASDIYNQVGPNVVEGDLLVKLYSFSNQDTDRNIVLYDEENKIQDLKINTSDASTYFPNGDGLALGFTVQTKFDDSQIGGGRYGLKFEIEFKDNMGNEEPVVREYTVTSADLYGNPFLVIRPKKVEKFNSDVDMAHFNRIKKITAFCESFPIQSHTQKDQQGQDKIVYHTSKTGYQPDILISNITVNGGTLLVGNDLEGYCLHIDYSKNGKVINDNINTIQLQAQVKIRGKIATENLQYYWFKQNPLIFRGSDKYSNRGGDGWECLNHFEQGRPIPLTDNHFYFGNLQTPPEQILYKYSQTESKVTKILCVAVYNNLTTIEGKIDIIDQNKPNVCIQSSDTIGNDNKTIYYLDSGSPTLTCKVYDTDGKNLDPDGTKYIYTWSELPANGSLISNADIEKENINIENYDENVINYNTYIEEIKQVEESKQGKFAEIKNIEGLKDSIDKAKGILKNRYIHFPISSITGSTKIMCRVTKEDNNVITLIGSTSITLYNKMQVEGMYTLNIDNGTQIFQYNEKGNSPFVIEEDRKPLNDAPPALSFTLLDNTGKKISYQQIVDNGEIRWLFPGYDTLLISEEKDSYISYNYSITDNTDMVPNDTDITLAANLYNIYKNKEEFKYTIQKKFDLTKTNNTIGLVVKYKDIILQQYTDFTFPKNGDPGNNGTDLFAKIMPVDKSNNIISTDRIYISNKEPEVMFADSGAPIEALSFKIYNNGVNVTPSDKVPIWTCSPKTDDNSNIDIEPNGVLCTCKLSTSKINEPIDIVRATYTKGSDINALQYYADYPICCEWFKNTDNENYRIKVKPKTGFKYVVYEEDGTHPNYDNSKPFEIIVEKLQNDSYYTSANIKDVECEWKVTKSSLKDPVIQNDTRIATIVPQDSFISSDLTTAIEVTVKVGGAEIGTIHIPIYMSINRYGHNAINGWDGNSINLQFDKTGKPKGSTILAPQVGAGTKKDGDNGFTGILMGVQHTPEDSASGTSETTKVGLFGYDNGERSIFLDAETGNATFGKNGAAQIKIDARSGQGTIASGDYPVDDNGKPAGMKIKFSSTPVNASNDNPEKGPYIKYGSNNFSVNAKGHIHAAGGGDIAGWNISDDKIYKHVTPGNWAGMASQNWTTGDINGTLPNTTDTVAFYAGETHFTKTTDTKVKNRSYYIYNSNSKKYEKVDPPKEEQLKNYYNHYNNRNNFYVTHNGYLFAKYGNIAGWDFNDKALSKSDVGMGQNESPITFTYNSNNSTATITTGNARFWAKDKFVVDKDGKLYSKSAQIGPWTVGQSQFTNGATGMGSHFFADTVSSEKDSEGKTYYTHTNPFYPGHVYSDTEPDARNINARLWSGSNDKIDNLKFAVDSSGNLYSKAGRIGGWTIQSNSLSMTSEDGGIQILSSGTIKSNNGKWSIGQDGTVTFKQGTIGSINIKDGGLFGGGTTTSNSNWYITPKEAKLPGLELTDNKIIFSYSDGKGTGTINGSGVSLGDGTNNNSWISPKDVYDGDGMTLEKHFAKLSAQQMYADIDSVQSAYFKRLYVYPDMTVNLNDYSFDRGGTSYNFAVGSDVITLGTNNYVLKTLAIYADSLHVKGKYGLSAVINFNNDTYIEVKNGIVIKAKDQKGKEWEGQAPAPYINY